MSELINNQQKMKQEKLKALIRKLHDGVDQDLVQKEFNEHFGQVSASEISAMEQELVKEGMAVTDIQKLCDVHASVFKGSIADIHHPDNDESWPGHPVTFLRAENAALETFISDQIEPATAAFKTVPEQNKDDLLSKLERLQKIDRHYSKKENLLFSYLEKHDVTAPPKVMWGVDDEIRAMIKDAIQSVADYPESGESGDSISFKITETIDKVREMIFKEDNILLPMSLEKLDSHEWRQIAIDSREIGFYLITPPPEWPDQDAGQGTEAKANVKNGQEDASDAAAGGKIRLPSGEFTLASLTAMLNTLPFDMTFVDHEDRVRYFSQGSERIFDRNISILGREVANCHPPASVHIVEEIVNDFKSGKRDHADFWIKMGPKYVYIRYFAVRGEDQAYLGTLEVTQDIAPIQAIDGEKRLLDS